jgi:FtsZ-binding cell division protein ZapB
MEFSNLEKLEQKLTTFIVRLQKLQNENQELRKQNAELQMQLDDRNLAIQQLEEEIERLQEAQSVWQENDERDELIRQKISEMLKKLDLLENSITES